MSKGIQTEAYVVDHAKGDFSLREVTLEEPKDDEVLVEVKASGPSTSYIRSVGHAIERPTGICQTDIAARENHFQSCARSLDRVL